MPDVVKILIAVVLTLLVTAVVTWFAAITYRKKIVESKIGTAEEKARWAHIQSYGNSINLESSLCDIHCSHTTCLSHG